MVPISFNAELHLLIVAVIRFWRYFMYLANGNFGLPITRPQQPMPPQQPQQPIPSQHPQQPIPPQQWTRSAPQTSSNFFQPPGQSHFVQPSTAQSAGPPPPASQRRTLFVTPSLRKPNESEEVPQKRPRHISVSSDENFSDCSDCEFCPKRVKKVLDTTTIWVVGSSDEELIRDSDSE